MPDEKSTEEPAGETQPAGEKEDANAEPKKDALKDTDRLPSEEKEARRQAARKQKDQGGDTNGAKT